MFGQVRVYVVVVGDGIWAAGATFDYVWIVTPYAVTGVVCIVGVLNNARIPYVGDA